MSLADLHRVLGSLELAHDCASQALDGGRATGHRLIRAEALRVLGEIAFACGRSSELHRISGYGLGVERALSSSRRS